MSLMFIDSCLSCPRFCCFVYRVALWITQLKTSRYFHQTLKIATDSQRLMYLRFLRNMPSIISSTLLTNHSLPLPQSNDWIHDRKKSRQIIQVHSRRNASSWDFDPNLTYSIVIMIRLLSSSYSSAVLFVVLQQRLETTLERLYSSRSGIVCHVQLGKAILFLSQRTWLYNRVRFTPFAAHRVSIHTTKKCVYTYNLVRPLISPKPILPSNKQFHCGLQGSRTCRKQEIQRKWHTQLDEYDSDDLHPYLLSLLDYRYPYLPRLVCSAMLGEE